MDIGHDIAVDIGRVKVKAMSHLKVSLQKLERYARLQGNYELSTNGGQVTLVFVPTLPEVLEKGDGDSPPRVVMHGTEKEGVVEFTRVEVERQNGTEEKDIAEAEMAYRSWLEYIEENY